MKIVMLQFTNVCMSEAHGRTMKKRRGLKLSRKGFRCHFTRCLSILRRNVGQGVLGSGFRLSCAFPHAFRMLKRCQHTLLLSWSAGSRKVDVLMHPGEEMVLRECRRSVSCRDHSLIFVPSAGKVCVIGHLENLVESRG